METTHRTNRLPVLINENDTQIAEIHRSGNPEHPVAFRLYDKRARTFTQELLTTQSARDEFGAKALRKLGL